MNGGTLTALKRAQSPTRISRPSFIKESGDTGRGEWTRSCFRAVTAWGQSVVRGEREPDEREGAVAGPCAGGGGASASTRAAGHMCRTRRRLPPQPSLHLPPRRRSLLLAEPRRRATPSPDRRSRQP
uniref:Uncharacterized protein n=1 Tax=Arundo donax TaxID=35708 RepID=A0A0A9EZ23_ARUDO